MHRTTNRFWRCFDSLPSEIQDLARANFRILQDNPRYPSLHFKKVGKLWSARVGRNFRALASESDDGYTWVWIGSHDDYDRLIN